MFSMTNSSIWYSIYLKYNLLFREQNILSETKLDTNFYFIQWEWYKIAKNVQDKID